jgi:CRISPR system Cascade subunit CasE
MYLSKITLQPSAQTAVELAKLNSNGAYASHQLLWRLFTEEQKRNFIFRQEVDQGGMPLFYVLSQTQPVSTPLFQVSSKAFAPKLRAGQRLAFKLRANPTICVTENGKQKRHDVLMHTKRQYKGEQLAPKELEFLTFEAAQKWLMDEKRLSAWGIQLDAVPEVQAYIQHRTQKGKKRTIQFSSVDFEGLLTVESPEKFLQQYAQGFGRAKSFGCGLMLIRPV